jgi:hypothetical protein
MKAPRSAGTRITNMNLEPAHEFSPRLGGQRPKIVFKYLSVDIQNPVRAPSFEIFLADPASPAICQMLPGNEPLGEGQLVTEQARDPIVGKMLIQTRNQSPQKFVDRSIHRSPPVALQPASE